MKPTERRLVADILENGEFESAAEAAEAAILALDAKRQDEPMWAAFVATNMRLGDRWLTVGRGPFGTRKQAERALLKVASSGPECWYGSIVKLTKGDER